MQDSIHNGTKLRNKVLQPSAILPMGSRQVSISHLKMLIAKLPKSHHGIVLNDICPDDRQNFESLRKVMRPDVTQCLQDNIAGSEATALYFKLCRYVTSAFIDPKISPLERVHHIWFSIFYLRIWRTWILRTEGYSLTENFITTNVYECIELNGHALIQLIIKFRDAGKAEHFIPVLFSSQPCESTFRQFRSMTSVFWTKINSSLHEMLHIVGRIELQNYITHFKIPEVVFPRNQKKSPKMEPYELPSNEEIFLQMNMARDEAIKTAKSFDIQLTDEEDLTCQLHVCEPGQQKLIENDDSFAEATAAENLLCKSFEHIDLKNDDEDALANSTYHELYGLRDYTDQNIIVDKCCPYTRIVDKNGQEKIVRKSSIVWALTNKKTGLSNDRLQRVQGKALEKANRRTLSSIQPTIDEAIEDDKQIVWMDQNVCVGDWCFFLKDKSSKSTENLFAGQVVSFRYSFILYCDPIYSSVLNYFFFTTISLGIKIYKLMNSYIFVFFLINCF